MARSEKAPSPGFHGKAFLFAVLAAPCSAFLIWMVWISGTRGLGATSLIGGLPLLLLVTVWGAIPASAFGALVLVPLERVFKAGAPVRALVPAGLVAAGAYAACCMGLALGEQQWIFLAAPWVFVLLGKEQGVVHAIGPVLVAIVLSGAVGAWVYASMAGRVGRVRPA